MRELRQKQIIKRRLYSAPALIILLIITGLIIRSTWNMVKKYKESVGHVETLKQEEQMLSNKEVEFKEGIRRLGTDKGIEDEIKEKFNVSKEGERVVIIVDKRDNDNLEATTTKIWYKKLWDAIIK